MLTVDLTVIWCIERRTIIDFLMLLAAYANDKPPCRWIMNSVSIPIL